MPDQNPPLNSRLSNFWMKGFRSPWSTMAFYLPIIALLLGLIFKLGSFRPLQLIAYFGLGILSWTFVEYLLHRFVFHLTRGNTILKAFASKAHLDHHRDTQNSDLIIAAPATSVGFGGLFYLLFALFSQSFLIAAVIYVGFISAYLIYEWTHFAAHCFNAKNFIARYLRQYHLLHHFKNPNKWYGVTSPLWDWVFGTHA